jgi:hypothetical protein
MLSTNSPQDDQAILMPVIQRDPSSGLFYGFVDYRTVMFHDGRPTNGSSTSGLALCQAKTEKQCKLKLRIKVDDIKRVYDQRGFKIKVNPVQVINNRKVLVAPSTI